MRAANRFTADRWARYERHRARVTDLLLSSVPAGRREPTLCVLGAGNCNDIDLAALAAVFSRVHLVDIDGEALRAAVARQGPAPTAVCLHGGVDVTALHQHRPLHPSGTWGPERFDVVASTALLSQLIQSTVEGADPGAPELLDVVVALRRAHLQGMAALVQDGGRGVLISDVVSSATRPGLASVPEADLPALLVALIQQGDFFTGTNPYAICSELGSMAVSGPAVTDVTLHPPWVWQMGPEVHRLVYAVTFSRR